MEQNNRREEMIGVLVDSPQAAQALVSELIGLLMKCEESVTLMAEGLRRGDTQKMLEIAELMGEKGGIKAGMMLAIEKTTKRMSPEQLDKALSMAEARGERPNADGKFTIHTPTVGNA